MPSDNHATWILAGLVLVLLTATSVLAYMQWWQNRGPCRYLVDCTCVDRAQLRLDASGGPTSASSVRQHVSSFQELQARCPAYVINLDRSQDRWAKAQQRVRDAGFRNVIRHSGVDALKPGALEEGWKRHGSPAKWQDDFNFVTLNPGKQGCFLSHVDVLRRIIDDQTPLAVVFEDDIAFHPDFATLAPQYYDVLTPKDFDLLFLGAQLLDEYPVPKDVLVARGVPVQCTHAYVVTLEGAKKLYDSLVGPGPRATGVYTIDLMMRDTMGSGRAPYVWYVWHGRKFPVRRPDGIVASDSHKNAGLVFQDDDFLSLIEIPNPKM